PTTLAPTTLAPTTVAPTTTAGPTTTHPQIPRVVHDQAYAAFAVTQGVIVRLPSASVERVGFHESNHDGAQQLEPYDLDVRIMTMESRQRDTGSRTAADIVVQPDTEIRAPVSGTIVRAGHYILYCDHDDHYAVIEPDEQPGWEVKLLHIQEVQVAAGDRVEAGATVIAPRARPLPFASQVDDFTAEPSWPHVHLEIVDPSIPDRPSGTSC
ncbi:MAG: M23 family metallopeptidase, partial [Actinomycetia bacterium]|nr:M23 family metallopeptidase [Actinomycetes bacterium]